MRIEEQGKHLQKIFEEQQKATGDIINASPSSRATHTRSSEPVILECEPFLLPQCNNNLDELTHLVKVHNTDE